MKKRMKKRLNERAQGLSITTLVLVVLAIAALVLLLWALSGGLGELWKNVFGLGSGKVNVQTVVQGCQIACSTQASFDFCQLKKSVVFTEDKNDVRYRDNNQKFACRDLVFKDVGLTPCDQIVCDVALAPAAPPVAPNPPATP